MARVKRGVTAHAKHKKVLKAAKGYYGRRKNTIRVAKQAVDEYYPKSAMQMGEIRDLDRTLKEALDAKFLPSAKTAKDVEGMIDIVYKPAK